MKYFIDVPPPTISGKLHIGHLYSYSQGDIIAKYRKYKGNEVIYPFCFDNNGIPTFKLASKNGVYQPNDIFKFSIEKSKDNTYDKISQEVCLLSFYDLLEKGFLYKKETEFLYCPITKCSVAESELTEDGLYERSGVKPVLKTGIGYFVDIMNHKKMIIEAINQIEWKPEKHKKRLLNWISEIKYDWCISRDRHFGINIPNEEMTFDTWFISSLTPQITYSNYIGKATLEVPIFDLRYQSHDIIRTWALFTIVKSIYHNNQIPWKTILITGHAISNNGEKFSKTKGNAKDVSYYIDNFGANGIRFWSLRGTLGEDTIVDEKMMKMGFRIRNKFENALNFINFQKENNFIGEDDVYYSKYLIIKEEILREMEIMNYDKSIQLIYDFLWKTYCDVWIENSKKKSIVLTLEKILNDFEPLFSIFFESEEKRKEKDITDDTNFVE
jgi:valyl-tRNA synthetase